MKDEKLKRMKNITYWAKRTSGPGADYITGNLRMRTVNTTLAERRIASEHGLKSRHITMMPDGRLIIGRPNQYPLYGQWEVA